MATATDAFAKRYQKALNSYLSSGSEEALTHAYDLGRRALTTNVTLLDVAGIHQDALSTVLRKPAKKPKAAKKEAEAKASAPKAESREPKAKKKRKTA